MATNRFVVYDTAQNNQIVSLPVSQEAANTDAAGSSDYTAHVGAVEVPDRARPGTFWRFNVTDTVVRYIESELTSSEIVVRRRAKLLSLARQLEIVPGLGAWTAGELNGAALADLSVRSKSYSRWVEMITRAIAVDANLSNDSRHAILLREASHPGRVWYWLHWAHGVRTDDAAQRGSYWANGSTFNESRLGWSWYSTTGPDVFDTTVRIAGAYVSTPNTRGYITAAQVTDGAETPSVNAGSDFNWVVYLS